MTSWHDITELNPASDATMAGHVLDTESSVRDALDDLYKPRYATVAEATAGTRTDLQLNPSVTRQAFNSWLPAASYEVRPETALFAYNSAAFTHQPGAQYALNWGEGGGWTSSDPTGLTATDGAWIVVQKDGLYELSAHIGIGREDSVSGTASIWWALPGRGTTRGKGYGVAQMSGEGVISVHSTPTPILLRQGQSVALLTHVTVARPIAGDARAVSRIAITRLGPAQGWGFS